MEIVKQIKFFKFQDQGVKVFVMLYKEVEVALGKLKFFFC